ncbi:MAG: B12-binding domain-containing radical SAM protein, partial [Anaerovorax sp.]
FKEKHNYLRERLKPIRGVTFNYHNNETSHMEAIFAKGDRRLGDTLIKAVALGCKFDGWTEHFKYNLWMQALKETHVDGDFYAFKRRSYEELLPWDLIDTGIKKDFLIEENKQAIAEIQTPDCRKGCTGCGINERINCEMEGTL